MVSIVTCVGTTCCAVGIGIVWGHHFYENIYRRWKKSPTVNSSLTEDTQSSEDYQSNFHWWGKGPTVDSSLDKIVNPDGKASAVDKEDQDSGNYIRDLQSIRKDPDAEGDTFNHFKRGEIDHLRCSPDGRWVVICHRHACIVYDLGVRFLALTFFPKWGYSRLGAHRM